MRTDELTSTAVARRDRSRLVPQGVKSRRQTRLSSSEVSRAERRLRAPAESAAEEREAAALLAEPPAGPCKARGAFFSPRYRQRSPTPSPRAARQRPSRDPAHLSGRRPEVRALSGK